MEVANMVTIDCPTPRTWWERLDIKFEIASFTFEMKVPKFFSFSPNQEINFLTISLKNSVNNWSTAAFKAFPVTFKASLRRDFLPDCIARFSASSLTRSYSARASLSFSLNCFSSFALILWTSLAYCPLEFGLSNNSVVDWSPFAWLISLLISLRLALLFAKAYCWSSSIKALAFGSRIISPAETVWSIWVPFSFEPVCLFLSKNNLASFFMVFTILPDRVVCVRIFPNSSLSNFFFHSVYLSS